MKLFLTEQHKTGGQRWKKFCILDGPSSSVRHFFMRSMIKMQALFWNNAFTLLVYKMTVRKNKKELLAKWRENGIIIFEVFSHFVTAFSFFFFFRLILRLHWLLWNDENFTMERLKMTFSLKMELFVFYWRKHEKMSHRTIENAEISPSLTLCFMLLTLFFSVKQKLGVIER